MQYPNFSPPGPSNSSLVSPVGQTQLEAGKFRVYACSHQGAWEVPMQHVQPEVTTDVERLGQTAAQ